MYEKLINWNNSSFYGLTGLDNWASPKGLFSLGTAIAQQQQQQQTQYQSYSPFQVRWIRSWLCITPSQQQEQQPTLIKIYQKEVW